MEKGIARLVEIISEEGGKNPLVFLDTGSIIHFENKLAENSNKHLTSEKLYSLLKSKFNVYVTEGVLKEVGKHQDCIFNRRVEISENTGEIITDFHDEYCNFLKQFVSNPKQFNQVRYDTYNAGEIAHFLRTRDNPKKVNKERLSIEDRGVLENASFLRYSIYDKNNPITGSIILSTDSLLQRSADILCDRSYNAYDEFGSFGYDYIKVINVEK